MEKNILEKLFEFNYQTGSGEVNDNDHIVIIFKEYVIFYLIFFISIIAALYTVRMPDIVGIVFKEDDPDNNLQDANFIFNNRWNKIIRYTSIFISIVIAYNLLLFFVYYVIISMQCNTSDETKALFLKKIISTAYIFIFLSVTILLFVFFLLYFKFNKSYFNTIFYQNIVDKTQDDPPDEFSQPVKYIHYYALLLIICMLFCFMIVNLDINLIKELNLFTFLAITVIIIVLLYMSISSIRNLLYRNMKNLILYCLIGVLLPVLIVIVFYKLNKTKQIHKLLL
jgi:hypothetical protein